ncbi:MAG: hypothetical protein R3F61_35435 [Myxococcota bacterium]
MWQVLAMLVGCQAPFGRDRHDLVGSRIAAVTARTEDGAVHPRLALVVEGRAWSDEPASIDWFWIEREGDAADLVSGTFGVGLGPAPRIPIAGERLGVVVDVGGEVLRAELEIAGRTESDVRLTTASLDLSLATVAGEDLALDARRQRAGTPSHRVEPGGFARFTLEGAGTDGLGRFMATGDGTFFELDPKTADWVAGELVVDDLEIEESTEGEPGVITAVAVEIAPSRSGFAAADLFVGTDRPGVWAHDRFLPTDTPLGGTVWATLEADDASPTGLALADIEAAAPSDTWSASGLDCDGISGDRFEPGWLLEHRCLRGAVVGERVMIEVDP